MRVGRAFAKRRWLDFRQGHGVYLVFAMTFLNFVTIQYQLLITNVAALQNIFSEFWIFTLVFIGGYIPLSIALGNWHLKQQMPSEAEQLVNNNPFTTKTQPGKEKDYSLPAAIMGYEMQLQGMEMNNRSADLLTAIFKQDFPKWNEAAFERVRHYLDMTKRLQKGESITDITGKNIV